MHKKHILIVSVVVLGLAVSAVRAQSWTGGGGADNRWSNPANWNTGVPAVGVIATLANSAPNTPQIIDLDVSVSLSRLSCTATGNRDYTITTTNNSTITLTGSHDIYCVDRTTTLTIDCDVWTTSADLQVDRYGLTVLNGNCGGAYMSAQDTGELVLTGSNSLTYVWMFGGEIFVKNPYALYSGYFQSKFPGGGNPDGILSLGTSARIPGNLSAEYPLDLRLRDSGTNDVTLTVGGRCFGDRITVAPNAGTSTGHLAIRLTVASSHEAEWTLATNSTLVFANASGTASWGSSTANPHTGAVIGDGSVVVDSGNLVVVNSTNSYSGGTTVRGGILRIGANDRLPLDGDLTVLAGGTFDMLARNQTIRGLTGNGTVKLGSGTSGGTLTVNGTLAPGQGSGTLTFTDPGTVVLGAGATAVFELDALSGTSDQVALTSTTAGVTLNGTLEIRNAGGLQTGDYTLFDLNGGPISGGFTSIVFHNSYSGTLDTTSGDVVLSVKEPPKGTILTIQ